jgi:hypothetical protein
LATFNACIIRVALMVYAAKAPSFTTVVPKVQVTGSSSADTICEFSLFDVLFSPMLRGCSLGSPVSSLLKNQHNYELEHCVHRILNVVVVCVRVLYT